MSRKTVVDGWVKPSCTNRNLEDGDTHMCKVGRGWLGKAQINKLLLGRRRCGTDAL